jgi:ABC-type uncharacterized transport system involved in gliding motility auxiliary subunit
MGVLAEGHFESLYNGRPVPTDSSAPNPPTAKFLPNTALPTKQIAIADGNIVTPDHLPGRNNMPFDNLPFLLNCVDYLVNDSTYTQMRSKSVQLRQLDMVNVAEKRNLYQLLNLGGPILFVILFGVLRGVWRKRKNNALRLSK